VSDLLGFAGKQVVVTGCASGIGRALAARLIEQGAEVFGLDRQPSDLRLAGFHNLDLGDPAAIDAVHCTDRIDVLFNCAGLAPTRKPADVVRVNFLGTRRLTEVLGPRIPAGGAVVSVSSNASFGWRDRLPLLQDFVATPTFADGVDWFERHGAALGNAYAFSKQALVVWTLQYAQVLIKRGIRINCTSPGVVQTVMLEEVEAAVPREAIEGVSRLIGRRSTPEDQAWPLLMLGSEAAAYINGVDLPVDGGWSAAQTVALEADT
jgi:NAD(P)-dependent dehydrogenase (short-subunit alcohol dehydrogenase family)